MSRKGFTLVELLAVIVVLALVLTIAIPTSIEAYKKAKLKTEDVFVKRLSEVIDDYTSLASQDMLDTKLTSSIYEPEKTFKKNVNIGEQNKNYKVYKLKKTGDEPITVGDLISNGLLFEAKYVNPNNKNEKCSPNAIIEIYKDSDAVYCHKIKASSLGCLTTDYINSLRDPYAIDTCIWKEAVNEEAGE